ncbi:hypothetical protein [Legionella sp. W05-934-2]|uniref:hypothetical protein n=1 Tax=Legionella sp. W05-934-2 TaxID=1198649 RepID=UPI003462DAF3
MPPVEIIQSCKNNSPANKSVLMTKLKALAYLAGIKKITRFEIEQLVNEAEAKGRVVGIRLEITEEENRTPWKATVPLPIIDTLPKKIHLVISNEIFIEKESLPSPLLNRLIRIAAFQNPDFYKAQDHSKYEDLCAFIF